MSYQHDPLLDHDRQQAAQDALADAALAWAHAQHAALADLSAVLDWLTDAISALEADDLNSAGRLVLVWLKAKRRDLNTQLLALSEKGEALP